MNPNTKLRGVNLGGWLILERWMTPKVFEGLVAEDEYTLCLELGQKARKRLENHWQSFITKSDFLRIKKKGMNCIRLPVGYWNFDSESPFISSINYFEKALDWAEQTSLEVIIDLHAAPGSQNGWDHSGRIGEVGWHLEQENINRTLKILKVISEKYGKRTCVAGIELLNEPHWDIPLEILEEFYKKGYETIREYADEKVAIIMHDSFRPYELQSYFKNNSFTNVMLDCHLYQCFKEEDITLDIFGHLQKTAIDWKNLIGNLQQDVPVMIGEWSLGINPQALHSLNDLQKKLAKEAFLKTQLLVFEQASAWFLWSYKLNAKAMKADWSIKALSGQLD